MFKFNKFSAIGIAFSLAAFLFVPSASALEIGAKQFSVIVPKNWQLDTYNQISDSSGFYVVTNDSDEVLFQAYPQANKLTSATLILLTTGLMADGAELTVDSRTTKSIGEKQFDLYMMKLLTPNTPEEADIRFVAYTYSQPTFQFFVLTGYADSLSGQALLKDLETTLATLRFSGTSGLRARKNLRNTQESFPSYDILGRNQTRRLIRAPQNHTPVYK